MEPSLNCENLKASPEGVIEAIIIYPGFMGVPYILFVYCECVEFMCVCVLLIKKKKLYLFLCTQSSYTKFK